MIAQEIMDPHFHFLRPDDSIAYAVQQLKAASESEEKMIFGMMVMDEQDKLVGMLSMYDILQFIRPKHIEILGQMDDLDFEPVFDKMINQINHVRVEDIMSTDIFTISASTHLMVIIDTMVQKHIRRLPVVEDNRVVGILYRSDVFYFLMKQLSSKPSEV